MSAPKHYHFEVVMTCEGCSNAIKRVLTRLEPDVSEINISLEKQTVDVKSVLPFETVLDKIKKTGKEVKRSEIL
ncbi:LADA_0H02652g1_1 [Lachancea dasiensis]|uniref:LADA_0H02652g1_1 n=1 Tax=Lachancea dasiensis TaxID=1072105 RepID=A0A1G4JZW9_9SACH|nr:LADA_0H02652g1_1 [Lachancea dasiensis]